ncbi:MAG: hypothetical protein IJD00_02520 [Clostridia bacterium]|nr:hypothetical protein [Clostridia bacterium]
MNIKQIGNITDGQDGAVFGGLLFRFKTNGLCYVYNLNNLTIEKKSPIVSIFTLDKADVIVPHSNSVVFGNEYYAEDDEFPLLYTNIYNNYSRCENKRIGVCCVYRIWREENEFKNRLVGLIEIGFTKDELWSSGDDIRPFGNFVIDKEKGLYHAFTMRDNEEITRYFSFKLPKVSNGVMDNELGVKKITLTKEDIIDTFDTEYHRFIQGACCEKGKIYSLEGFSGDEVNPPAMRIISTNDKKQLECVYFGDFGLTIEPELIDFENNVCYYGDNHGNLYVIEF